MNRNSGCINSEIGKYYRNRLVIQFCNICNLHIYVMGRVSSVSNICSNTLCLDSVGVVEELVPTILAALRIF